MNLNLKAGPAMSSVEGSPHKNIPGDDSDSDYENENIRPRGLTGLQNLGNTCYLNSALQSLSNCPPLTRYFLDCSNLIPQDKTLAKHYSKLINELWHKKRPSYVVPSGVVSRIKTVHPMFRGYTQQDAQEFLRCLMDQLHEELKMPYSDESEEDENVGARGDDDDGSNNASSSIAPVDQKVGPCVSRRQSYDSLSSQSEELDYETCDSGLSSEQSSTGGQDNDDHEESNEWKKLRKCATSQMDPSSLVNDLVANTKEKKETANLLEKRNERDSVIKCVTGGRAVMEGGDCTMKEGERTTQSTQHKQPTVHLGKTKSVKYESIISQTFDGKILSSVRCLNCNTVSTTKETFQDLSLPIPSKDHLHMLHAGYPGVSGVVPPKGGTCGEVHQGWLAWIYSWMKSWIIGPTISLQHCLLAFFSADELKGDNMYSCEKCKKLRNGLKYSKVLKLPEILSIHLKRFRHEFYSSKIGTYISFPLEGLDMEPYLHRGCKDEVTLYDLVAIICHHGTAGGGHYTSYCLNHLNDQWYEFDDQYVTEVDVSQVQNCEAYVLFYRKSNKNIESLRQKVLELEPREVSLLKFYISKQWLCRFQTFAEPGPISNKDFLCKHGGMPPGTIKMKQSLCEEIPQYIWEILYNRFGGGPVCNHLYACPICQSEHDDIDKRQNSESDGFNKLSKEFDEEKQATPVYALSMFWIKQWQAFVSKKTQNPPGPIENYRITLYKNSLPTLRHTSEYVNVSKDMWLFLHQIYGGGPELISQSAVAPMKPSTPASANGIVLSPTISKTSTTSTWAACTTKSSLTGVQPSNTSHSSLTQSINQPIGSSLYGSDCQNENRVTHDKNRVSQEQTFVAQNQESSSRKPELDSLCEPVTTRLGQELTNAGLCDPATTRVGQEVTNAGLCDPATTRVGQEVTNAGLCDPETTVLNSGTILGALESLQESCDNLPVHGETASGKMVIEDRVMSRIQSQDVSDDNNTDAVVTSGIDSNTGSVIMSPNDNNTGAVISAGNNNNTGAVKSAGNDNNTDAVVTSGIDSNTGSVIMSPDDNNTGAVIGAGNDNSTGTVKSAGNDNSTGAVISAGNFNNTGAVISAGNDNNTGVVVSAGNDNNTGVVISAGNDNNTGVFISAGKGKRKSKKNKQMNATKI